LKNPKYIDTLKDATITTIYKKGDRRHLEKGIVNRRKTRLKERSGVFSDSQGGGRPGRSIGMKVLNVINMIQIAKQQGKKPILIRFDLVKAYDKVSLHGILHAFSLFKSI